MKENRLGASPTYLESNAEMMREIIVRQRCSSYDGNWSEFLVIQSTLDSVYIHCACHWLLLHFYRATQ